MNIMNDLENFLQTPMDLLELPDSIFGLFEGQVTNPDQDSISSSSSTSNLNSLYCSTNCSRWPSFSSALDDIDSIINEDIWKDNNVKVRPKSSISARSTGVRPKSAGVRPKSASSARSARKVPYVVDIFNGSQDAQVQTDVNIPDYEGLAPLTLNDIQSKRRKSKDTLSEFSSRSGSSGKRSKRGRNVLHFLLSFLQEPSNHNFIHWVEKPQGIFRVDKNHANEIVLIWNQRKGSGVNVKDWNNFARTLRNYYKGEKYLEPVKEQYTYKFSREFMEHSQSADFDPEETF